MSTIFTVDELLNPPTYDEVKTGVYDGLIAAGFTAIRSYSPESLPVCLVETESAAIDQANQTAAFIVQSGYNSLASGDALTRLSSELYRDTRLDGKRARGFVNIVDTRGVGPRTFSAASVSFSRGISGKQYSGVVLAGVPDPVVLPKFGTCRVYVEAVAEGAAYNASVGEINTMIRGIIPGVTVSNPANWQLDAFGVAGADAETDASLQRRNTTKWETNSQYKTSTNTQGAYEHMARSASVEVTRVRVDTNLDLTDPGRADVTIAGPAGAVSAGTVTTVQLAIAPLQVGGGNIPETAKCVVTSAANLVVAVAGLVIVDATYNNATFKAQIVSDLQTWFGSFTIGGGKLGKVSYDRILGILSYRAGLSNNVVLDATGITINGGTGDLPIAYNQVPVPDLTGLTLQAAP